MFVGERRTGCSSPTADVVRSRRFIVFCYANQDITDRFHFDDGISNLRAGWLMRRLTNCTVVSAVPWSAVTDCAPSPASRWRTSVAALYHRPRAMSFTSRDFPDRRHSSVGDDLEGDE